MSGGDAGPRPPGTRRRDRKDDPEEPAAVRRPVDWGDVADSINERIAESPSWPELNTALTLAQDTGLDVTAALTRLASDPLPRHDPAAELRRRLTTIAH